MSNLFMPEPKRPCQWCGSAACIQSNCLRGRGDEQVRQSAPTHFADDATLARIAELEAKLEVSQDTNVDGIDARNETIRLQDLKIDALEREVASKQAKIDALMLEYCPNEMSVEQKKEWARNQRPVIDAAIKKEKENAQRSSKGTR